MSKNRPYIIGIAGGTGSGKTTISHRIREMVGQEHIAYLQHDSYYHDLSDMPLAERRKRNYDHPDSLDTTLLIQQVQRLQQGQSVEVPRYDFATHTRFAETEMLAPSRILLIEGILIFVESALRDLMDLRIFVDTDADVRFIRRVQRDIQERGRTIDSVIQQYLTTVRPMHLEFVEPSKRHADIIVPEERYNQVAMDMIASQIRAILAG